MMRFLPRLFLPLLALLGSSSAVLLGAAAPPNLLIIHTDEHNFRTLGCYRAVLPPEQALMWGEDAVVTTPHIDWLAKHGALCTSFYATTPVCSPSRSAFVSGRYPQNTPVVTNNIPMDDDIVTFAEILRQQGYATGYAGKWHLDGGSRPGWAPKRKFGFQDNRYMFNRGHWKQLEETPAGPRVKARNARGKATYLVRGANEKSFTTDFLADKTVAFIEAHKSAPFCFMVSIPDPHGPDSVRPPYDTMFKGQTAKAPRTFAQPDDYLPFWSKRRGGFNGMASYFGMVKCIDDNVRTS
jgi:arylsulfatase A-like enzyme